MTRREETLGRRSVLKGLASGAAVVAGGGFPALAQSAPARVGALVPLTDDADAYAVQMRAGIDAAVAEINGSGGLFGRSLEVVYRDSETRPAVLPDLCRDLVENHDAVAMVGPWVSAGRKYAMRYLARVGVPLVNATNHEGRYCNPALFSVGPTTSHDGHALVRHLDDSGAGKSYFLLGSYPSWQTVMFRQIRFPMAARDIHVLGEAQTDVGERDFRPVIRWIEALGVDVVLFCVMRRHGLEFIRQARDMGVLQKIKLGWIGFNETLNDALDPEDAARVVTTTPFASADRAGGVADFVARVRRQAGSDIPVSYCAFTHYNAVMALRAAWRNSGEASAAAAMAGLKGLTLDTATGPLTIDAESQHATMTVVAARGGPGGLQVVERLGPIAPEPGCTVTPAG